jgi:hypothetical protein
MASFHGDGGHFTNDPAHAQGVFPGNLEYLETPNPSMDESDPMILQRLLRLAYEPTPDMSSMNGTAIDHMADNLYPYTLTPHHEEFHHIPHDERKDDVKNHGHDSSLSMDDYRDDTTIAIGVEPRGGTPSSEATGTSPNQLRPHAAVEKRYRQTVNIKLQQLNAAIPPSGRFCLDPSEQNADGGLNSDADQAAKPVVLDRAIKYATHLIETYRAYEEEAEGLRQQVREWLGNDAVVAQEYSVRICDPGNTGC